MCLGYITNNAARSAAQVAAHIESFGLPCAPEQVVTSAQLAAAWLAQRFDAGSAVLVIGGSGLHEAVAEAGLRVVTTAADKPAAVVQGFGPDVGWRELAQASISLAGGVPWVATNLDLTVPTPDGAALGNGALVAALAAACGRRPDAVTGKPAAEVFAAAAERWLLQRPLVVGDRLDTDIAGARAAGLPSLLVLTGVSGVADVLSAGPAERPSFVGRDLSALFLPHPARSVTAGSVAVGGWSATIGQGDLRLCGDGDGVDALRAAAARSWLASDRGEIVRTDAVVGHLETLLGLGD